MFQSLCCPVCVVIFFKSTQQSNNYLRSIQPSLLVRSYATLSVFHSLNSRVYLFKSLSLRYKYNFYKAIDMLLIRKMRHVLYEYLCTKYKSLYSCTGLTFLFPHVNRHFGKMNRRIGNLIRACLIRLPYSRKN